MAVTGRGDFPFNSVWLNRRRKRDAGAFALLYPSVRYQLEEPWTNWALNELPNTTGNLTASIGEDTLTSDVEVLLQATSTTSIGEDTLTSDVEVLLQATSTTSIEEDILTADVTIINTTVTVDLTTSIGEDTLTSDVEVLLQATSTTSIGEDTLVSYSEITTGPPPPRAKPTPGTWKINHYGRIVPYTPPRWLRRA